MAKKIRVYSLVEGSKALYGGNGQFFYEGFKYTNKEIPSGLKDYFEAAGSMTKEELGSRPYVEEETSEEDFNINLEEGLDGEEA